MYKNDHSRIAPAEEPPIPRGPDPGKHWPREFGTLRKLEDDQIFVRLIDGLGAEGDVFHKFYFQDDYDPDAPCEVDEVADYCKELSAAGPRRRIWIDDRSSRMLVGSGDSRNYDNPLSPTELQQVLEEPV